MSDQIFIRPIPKSYNEQRDHFIMRLKERHGLVITDSEYDMLCSTAKFKGVYAKTTKKTVGYIEISGWEILVLRNKNEDGSVAFSTCYPSNPWNDIDETLRVCFGKREVYKIAKNIYRIIEEEIADFIKSGGSKGMKWLFCESKYCFPGILKSVLNNNVDPWKICRTIRAIIFNESDSIKLTVTKNQQQ